MSQQETKKPATQDSPPRETGQQNPKSPRPREINGPKGPEPTRFGDWEKNGRCIDF
ncbi:MAG TPA: DUF1674 domain-containing protein [Gammaproteobacteria bacterium]|nr:DUF1674 domain-containing protein [Gammaproteobacteria bacterium]